MKKQSSNFFRRRRICYWDSEKRFVDAHKLNFEKQLSFLPDFDLITLKSLDSENFNPCDLLLISALLVEDHEFSQWLLGINKRILHQNSIWTPALIFSEVEGYELSSAMHEFAANNWYFDIVNPKHIDSIPIRVANLLRIHDHLHEIMRYQERLDSMQDKIIEIESQLAKMRAEDK